MASPMKILAISGGLQTASINTALLRTVAQRSPPEIHVSVYCGLNHLPSFNPRMRVVPWIVKELQSRVDTSDALIIASPEYGCGISGALKNALNWLVKDRYLTHKPLAVINASERAYQAEKSLREALKAMSVHIVEAASFTFSAADTGLGDVSEAHIPRIDRELDRCLLGLKRSSTSQARRQVLANGWRRAILMSHQFAAHKNA